MNQVFVLMGREDDYESDNFCVGVFSTKEAAKAILPEAHETFPNHRFWIEPVIIDDFSWEKVEED